MIARELATIRRALAGAHQTKGAAFRDAAAIVCFFPTALMLINAVCVIAGGGK